MRVERHRFTGKFSFAFIYANPIERLFIRFRMRKCNNIFHADDYRLGFVIRPGARLRGAQFVMFTRGEMSK